ncbi:hypothetical protein GJ496_002739 [Pomphorhynchus laevis]|nr:hypothetical protein GJ496_002739 [Pomphorhynchus laevis]
MNDKQSTKVMNDDQYMRPKKDCSIKLFYNNEFNGETVNEIPHEKTRVKRPSYKKTPLYLQNYATLYSYLA